MRAQRRVALLAAAAVLLGGAAPAQHGLSVSPNRLVVARATPVAGGAAASASYALRATVGLVSDAGPAQSVAATLHAGISGSGAGLGPVPPVILALGPDAGAKAGGTALTVLGIGLSGATDLSLAGTSAPGLQVVSRLALTATTPAGTSSLTDPFGSPIEGNPLGAVDVAVTTSLGSDAVPGGFAYLPALVQTSEAHLGQALGIRFRSEPNALTALAAGFPTPGVGVPISGFGGALEVFTGLITIGGLVEADAAGVHDFVLPIPDKPGLLGATVWFQTASIGSVAPLGGEFTNVLTVVVQP